MAADPEAHRPSSELVLVGVSVATGSKAALQWAIDEARRREAPVRAVMVWRPSPLPGAANGRPPAQKIMEYDLQAIADETLEEYVRDAVGLDAGVEWAALEGKTRQVLLMEAEKAALLVLDSPRTSKLSSSVTQYLAPRLIFRSPCPVVVMPTPATPAAAAAKQDRDSSVEEPAGITG